MWQVTSGNDDLLPATCDLSPDEPIICVNPENLRPKPKSANIVHKDMALFISKNFLRFA
jgi:hypothetical protein